MSIQNLNTPLLPNGFNNQDIEYEPVNMKILDINEFIRQRNIKEVTSSFIFLPSTKDFHPDGLYSEYIFSAVGTTKRLTTFGYIDLKTDVFHPDAYNHLVSLNRLYGDIMSNKVTAVFDPYKQDFFRLSYVKEVKPEFEIGSGFAFFMKHYPKLKIKETNSIKRSFKIKILEKYSKPIIINKTLVLPAGLRDLVVDGGKYNIEEINKFYTKLLMYTSALPTANSTDPLWDSVRISIQKLLVNIDDYFFNICSGKTGFIQKKFASRSVALGSRNVLTGAKLVSGSSKGFNHTVNDSFVSLFQAAKNYLPLVIHKMFTLFLYPTMNQNSNVIYGIEPDTLDFVKLTLTDSDKEKYFTRQGLENQIENYRVVSLRTNPYGIYLSNKKFYYMFLLYDLGHKIYMFRNLKEFSVYYKENTNKDVDLSKVRPITNMEVLYIATSQAVGEKNCQITRFPVLTSTNTYASKTVVMTTEPSREVILVDVLSGLTSDKYSLPMWPMSEHQSVDGIRIHPIHLKNLGGDYDGDTVTNIGLMGKESNDEIDRLRFAVSTLLSANEDLRLKITCDITELTLANLSIKNKY